MNSFYFDCNGNTVDPSLEGQKESTFFPIGNYRGVITYSRCFTDKNDIGRFIIKIQTENIDTLFVVFMPIPLDKAHPIWKEIIQLINEGCEITEKDLIGEKVTFSISNKYNYYRFCVYTNICDFKFLSVEEDGINA